MLYIIILILGRFSKFLSCSLHTSSLKPIVIIIISSFNFSLNSCNFTTLLYWTRSILVDYLCAWWWLLTTIYCFVNYLLLTSTWRWLGLKAASSTYCFINYLLLLLRRLLVYNLLTRWLWLINIYNFLLWRSIYINNLFFSWSIYIYYLFLSWLISIYNLLLYWCISVDDLLLNGCIPIYYLFLHWSISIDDFLLYRGISIYNFLLDRSISINNFLSDLRWRIILIKWLWSGRIYTRHIWNFIILKFFFTSIIDNSLFHFLIFLYFLLLLILLFLSFRRFDIFYF